MAYAASSKSSDMSRQVGSVVSKNDSILSLGANDVPKYSGGTYWPKIQSDGSVVDIAGGRDYKIGKEANRNTIGVIAQNIFDNLHKQNISIEEDQLIEALSKAGIMSLTEFGRMLHAEMDSLLDCAKRGLSVSGATMYVTTFPCHNCAKHIIGSGIEKVVYIEPYVKSKALTFHQDSITEDSEVTNKVKFLPFEGLGPRYYMDLFSTSLSRGNEKRRKDSDKISRINFDKETASPRMKLRPFPYLGLENMIIQEMKENIQILDA